MSGPIGRPRGSKNKPDHQAGGARPGLGLNEGIKIIRGNGIADLYNIFKPKLSQQATSATENSAGHESSTEAPFPFLRPEPLDSDSDDESEADSDFEDLLDEAIPSKSLPDETHVDTEGVISLYLAGLKTKLVAELNSARDNPGVIPDEDLISESMPDQLPPVDTNLSGIQGADDGSTQMQIPMEVDFLDIVSHPSDPLPDTNYRGSTPMPYNTQPWHGIGQTLEFQPTYWPQQAGLASGSSQMNFVSYTGPPNLGKKQQRKCQNCVPAGQSGYNCPGESGRKWCKLLPCTSEIVQENSGI
ncbi:hypothetical protein C8J57DRAFT_1234836 [Mycena rebaudengoi]|nr:hypothetical protein C8J57DRAFT_1234836 [Mycena rebaudengoi]